MGAVTNKLRNIIHSDYKYRGRILDLRVDTVRFPSGADKAREVVEHKSAVAMLPVDDEGKIILVRQYRHAIDQDIFEIPAGIVEDGEDFRGSAVRELQEEIGYRPNHIEEIADFYSSPGYSTEKIRIFFVTELVQSKLPEDDDEYIKVFKFTPEELEKLISEKQIADGKTLMAYYWYMAHKCLR